MGLLRNTAIAALSLTAGFSSMASADYQYGFGNASINYLDWSKNTENRTDKQDFAFLELEGGAGFSWGELYGFVDLENPTKSNEEANGNGRRVAMKGTLRYYLGDTGFNLYAHIYDLSTSGFNEQNRLLGIGYNFQKDGLFFKPFVAANNTQTTFFSGANGYVAGWALGYSFTLAEQNLMVTNWHEYEFNRSENYSTETKDGVTTREKNGINGAVALWWNASDSITAGVQYRYADNKLGSNSYQNAMVYSLRYNF